MSPQFPAQVTWTGPVGIYRTPLLDDATAIRPILSDIETMKYLRFMTKEPNGWTLQQVEDRLKDQLQGQIENRKLVVHIIYEGKVVGMSGFTVIDTVHRNAETGIILDKDYWGKKIATEAFYFSLKWAFDEIGLHRVHWHTTETNVGMRGWLENVCQLKVEAINREVLNIQGEWTDSFTYALLEDDWRNRVKEMLHAKVYRK
ncbi:hypothetical protein HA402_005782 [Bradysia odoriphaga]|nr:hypothetical protein HA402_005782 [Bradysia odoriphaga]